MGAFNTLLANVECASCGSMAVRPVQFKYGDTWQHKYEIGDTLRWGGNDVGVRGAARVLVFGTAERCPACGAQGYEMVVVIERDVLARVEPLGHRAVPRTGGHLFEVEEE
jgi:hypothetical protein